MTAPAPTRREWSRALATAKVIKTPFWFIWMTPFAFGYLLSGRQHGFRDAAFAAVVTVGIGLGDAVCNLHNEIVDRAIDRINQPNRTALLDAIGVRTAIALVAFGYACAGAAIVLISLRVNRSVALWILCSAVDGFLYNSGPKFKRRAVVAELAIGGAVLLMFMAGWSWHASTPPPAAGWLLALFMGATVFLKDLPDAEGDAAVGAFGLFTISSAGARRLALAAIYTTPYAALAVLLPAGAIDGRAAWLCVLSPVALFLALAADRAVTAAEKLVAYQLSFLYVHTFALGLLVAEVHTGMALGVAGGLFTARVASLRLGLDPRLVEPDFRWSSALAAVWARVTARPEPVVIDLRDTPPAPAPPAAAPAAVVAADAEVVLARAAVDRAEAVPVSSATPVSPTSPISPLATPVAPNRTEQP